MRLVDLHVRLMIQFFFFQAEDGIRDLTVTGVQTCALPISKRLDGVGRCGRQYCCSSWLPELRPVSLALAKDQHLSLNPSQISGGCGRLLCCLRYEHDFYVQTRKRFPKEGRVLRTAKIGRAHV